MSQYRGRRNLLWLIVPYLLFVVLVSPLAIWLVSRGDPLYAANEAEATDVD